MKIQVLTVASDSIPALAIPLCEGRSIEQAIQKDLYDYVEFGLAAPIALALEETGEFDNGDLRVKLHTLDV